MKKANLIHFKLVLLLLFLFLGFSSATAQSLKVHEVSFYAPSVDRDLKFNIVLPKDYESSNRHYPVLYMLHGLTSNYQAWGRMGVPEYLYNYDLIVVIPDLHSVVYDRPQGFCQLIVICE